MRRSKELSGGHLAESLITDANVSFVDTMCDTYGCPVAGEREHLARDLAIYERSVCKGNRTAVGMQKMFREPSVQ